MKTLTYVVVTLIFVGSLILFRILLRKIDKFYFNDGKCIRCGKPLKYVGENEYKEHYFVCQHCGFNLTTPYFFLEEK